MICLATVSASVHSSMGLGFVALRRQLHFGFGFGCSMHPMHLPPQLENMKTLFGTQHASRLQQSLELHCHLLLLNCLSEMWVLYQGSSEIMESVRTNAPPRRADASTLGLCPGGPTSSDLVRAASEGDEPRVVIPGSSVEPCSFKDLIASIDYKTSDFRSLNSWSLRTSVEKQCLNPSHWTSLELVSPCTAHESQIRFSLLEWKPGPSRCLRSL